jgi:hypothetical protein
VTDPFSPFVKALANRSVRYVLIGVSGANLYTLRQAPMFVTDDRDLFLPADADNLVQAWAAGDDAKMDLQADLTLVMKGFDFEVVWTSAGFFPSTASMSRPLA